MVNRVELLNPTELEALKNPISNEARVLYCLGLRPIAQNQTGLTEPLHYKSLLALLNSKEKIITLGRQINRLLSELVEVGLISATNEIEKNLSCNGKSLVLPLAAININDYSNMHTQWKPMQLEWQPHSELYQDLAKLVGIIDKTYSDNELGDFIAYWLGRPESQHTVFQWTQKFVFFIKKQRLALGYSDKKRVGNQVVTKKAGISTDSNTKKLVEKYHAKYQR
jgi:hypothetical protein